MFRLVAASMLCSTLLLPAQEPPKAGEKPPAATPAKPAPVFVIAKAGDKLEVITKEAFEAKNKQLAADYTKAMEQYEKDKKAAEAAHKKFEGVEPKKTALEMVGSEHPTQAAADAAMKKLQDEKAKADDKAKEPKKDDKKK
jgi:hypothetical protein